MKLCHLWRLEPLKLWAIAHPARALSPLKPQNITHRTQAHSLADSSTPSREENCWSTPADGASLRSHVYTTSLVLFVEQYYLFSKLHRFSVCLHQNHYSGNPGESKTASFGFYHGYWRQQWSAERSFTQAAHLLDLTAPSVVRTNWSPIPYTLDDCRQHQVLVPGKRAESGSSWAPHRPT